MFVKIHGTQDYFKGNTQSCVDLVNYLGKENEEKELLLKTGFFSHRDNNVNEQLVIHSIDNNKKGLKEKDAKFFMLTVNPSERELKHIAKIATNGKPITELSQMSSPEQERYNNMIKDYVREIMEEYANGFNKGLTAEDLVYFCKLEQQRHFTGYDKEVKLGTSSNGDLKPGLQTHVHVIVSRKDKSQKQSISPLARSRAKNTHKLNGKSVTVGIDRKLFMQISEEKFDRMFRFQRDYKDSFVYYNYQTNPLGTLNEAAKLNTQLIENPEIAAKNLVLTGIEKATSGQLPLNSVNAASKLVLQPESAKDIMIQKIEQLASQLLPPEVRLAKSIAEKTIKPLKDLSSGLDL
jgi:Family of unknown function (DUF5712)